MNDEVFDDLSALGRKIGDNKRLLETKPMLPPAQASNSIQLRAGGDAAEDGPGRSAAVVQGELQSFLDFFTAWQSSTFTARKSDLEKVSKST